VGGLGLVTKDGGCGGRFRSLLPARNRTFAGGTSGIGLRAARQFIKEGAKIVMIGRSPQSVGDAQKEIGANGVAIAADVTKSAELDSLFRRVREKYGRIDVLYANAGIAKLGSVAETTTRPSSSQSNRHIRLRVPLAFLSPRIVVAIVNGTAPADLTVTGLAKDRELQPVDFP
jgi:NAD(P)-dependent dehydrogenase (short-subunit alcohol dehydrogenase family)